MLTIIAAVSDNNIIGVDNSLPWHCPEDLAHFKQLTLNKPVIMGRKTFESLKRPLPNRLNIVVSRNCSSVSEDPNVVTLSSFDDAVSYGLYISNDVCIIGGGEIYKQALEVADFMVLTKVHVEVEGDVTFPSFTDTQWERAYTMHVFSKTPCDFCVYRRIQCK